jgi:hypothetical protein
VGIERGRLAGRRMEDDLGRGIGSCSLGVGLLLCWEGREIDRGLDSSSLVRRRVDKGIDWGGIVGCRRMGWAEGGLLGVDVGEGDKRRVDRVVVRPGEEGVDRVVAGVVVVRRVPGRARIAGAGPLVVVVPVGVVGDVDTDTVAEQDTSPFNRNLQIPSPPEPPCECTIPPKSLPRPTCHSRF